MDKAKEQNTTQMIPVVDIDDSAIYNNSRGPIAPSDVDYLVRDIEVSGQLQPIIVRKINEEGKKPYRVVAGFSRTLAFRIMKRKEIWASVIDCDDEAALIINLGENIVRKNPDITQEARALQEIVARYPYYTEEKLATTFNKSRGWVQIRLFVNDLPTEIQTEIGKGFVTQEQIRQIHQMKTPDEQFKAVKKLKEAAERGSKIRLTDAPPTDPHERRPRNPKDILGMQEFIQSNFGPCVMTRVLAWATGYISDLELYEDLQKYATELNVDFEIPTTCPKPSEE